ncbi:15420_t:CDS:2, partial [Gigaspora rosea]
AQKRRMIEELKIKFNELSGHENQHDESPEQTELDSLLSNWMLLRVSIALRASFRRLK